MEHDAELEALLDEQVSYYRERAGEYDDWFLRKRRYDRGRDPNRRWFEQVEEMRRRLSSEQAALPGDARVLELACGTGLWTERLVAQGARVTAIDASTEVIERNRERLAAAGCLDQVDYRQADLFHWSPSRRYDLVFFGFWLSHVPPEHFESFWSRLADAVEPGGRVFFVDSLFAPESGARDHRLPDRGDNRAKRTLADGREFDIVKVFYEPVDLEKRLSSLGWTFDVRCTADYFLHAAGGRS
jgi:demethylmenaquinone methyltransferase/2-methoxy-6-polyprenyl-1,4-benzoquinol methylase